MSSNPSGPVDGSDPPGGSDSHGELGQSDEPNSGASRLLVLMRHAKSDWGNESLSDHDRPLNPRGRRDAPAMARWLADVGALPDRILCSSAERTRETVALMSPEWESSPEVSICQDLYLATPETILSTINADGWDADVLMVVAHNPGTTHLVCHLSDEMIEMPTAAIAIFRVEIPEWGRMRPSVPAKLIHVMRPKAL